MSPRISFIASLVFHLLIAGGIVIFLLTAQDNPQNSRFAPQTFSLVNSLQKMRSAISTPHPTRVSAQSAQSALKSLAKPAPEDNTPAISFAPQEKSDSLSTILTALQSSQVLSGQPSADAGETGRQENTVVDSKNLDSDLVAVFTPEVPYPQQVRDLEIEGTFEAVLSVRSDGTVTEIEVLRSPHPLITAQAKKTIMTWRFKSPTYKGKPVNARAILPILFSLN